MTRVQNKSLFSGQLNEMDLPVTPEQLARWQDGEGILVAMPGLNHDQLEFLISGMTPNERRKRFAPLAVPRTGRYTPELRAVSHRRKYTNT